MVFEVCFFRFNLYCYSAAHRARDAVAPVDPEQPSVGGPHAGGDARARRDVRLGELERSARRGASARATRGARKRRALHGGGLYKLNPDPVDKTLSLKKAPLVSTLE